MPSVNVADFTSKSASYARAAIAKANANGSTYLTLTEAKSLPKDLKDNFENFRGEGSVSAAKFATAYAAYVKAAAQKADTNDNGLISPSEVKKLPFDLQDNLANFSRVKTATAPSLEDETLSRTIGAHLRAYGPSKVSYDEAFKIAEKSAFFDEYGPRYEITEMLAYDLGETPSKSVVNSAVAKANKSLRLLDVGDSNEMGDDPRANWIFELDCDDGGDNGYWITVDRKTGEAFASSFN